MNNIFIIMYPSVGHINSSLYIGHCIKSMGLNPLFLIEEKHVELISQNNFNYVVLKTIPFGIGAERIVANYNYINELQLRISSKLILKRYKELKKMYYKYTPSIIFIDSMLASDFLIFYEEHIKNKTKIYLLNTMTSLRFRASYPNINFNFKYSFNTLNYVINYFFYVKKIVNNIIQCIKFLGFDDLSVVNKIIRKIDKTLPSVDSSYGINYISSTLYELILNPIEMEFFSKKHLYQKEYFLGIPILHRNQKMNFLQKDIINKLIQYKNSDVKIIYCSFGTNYEKFHEKSILNFLKLIDNIQIEDKKLLFVVSLKEDTYSIINKSNHSFLVSHSFDQLKILYFTDVFISHGGINSVKEAIHTLTPMLLYPIDKRYDQQRNSMKIQLLGLGIAGNILKDSEIEIKNKIEKLISDSSFVDKAKRFKNNFNDEKCFEFIKNLIKESLVDKN